MLLIYSNQQRPDAQRQIEDLRQLRVYGESTRTVAPHVPTLASGESVPVGITIGAARRERDAARSSIVATVPLGPRLERHQLSHCKRNASAFELRSHDDPGSQVGSPSRQGGQRRERRGHAKQFGSRHRAFGAGGRRSSHARWCCPGEEPLPPQIQDPLDEYLDESGVMSAVLLPLHAPDQPRSGGRNRDVGVRPAYRRGRHHWCDGAGVLFRTCGDADWLGNVNCRQRSNACRCEMHWNTDRSSDFDFGKRSAVWFSPATCRWWSLRCCWLPACCWGRCSIRSITM